MDNPIEILEQAVSVAQHRGATVSGWMLQSGPDAFVAWLYADDDEQGSWSLFDEVETCATALDAARWVMAEAQKYDPPA